MGNRRHSRLLALIKMAPALRISGLWKTYNGMSVVKDLSLEIYTIDGFRHSILGLGDVSLYQDFGVTAGMSLLLFLWAAFLIHKGYRLKQ